MSNKYLLLINFLFFVVSFFNDQSTAAILKRHTTHIVAWSQLQLPSGCKTECQKTPEGGHGSKCTTTCPGTVVGPFVKKCLEQCQGSPVDQRTDLKPECQTKCRATNTGSTNQFVSQHHEMGEFQQTIPQVPQQTSMENNVSSVITQSMEMHQFGRMEDCVKYCQDSGIGKSEGECRAKCQSGGSSITVVSGNGPTVAAREAIPPEVPQLTLNVPIMTKTTEMFGKFEDCLKFCVAKGIGKSEEECRGKCQTSPQSVGSSVITTFAQG